MLVKIIIVALLFFIIFSLGRAMFSLVRSNGDSDRTIKALTWRISLSVLLF
ncbi:MAG: twin transmembrane helix small protein, partial [Gammaproteobacteria bacterium]